MASSMTAYQRLHSHFDKIGELENIAEISHWDEATMMPEGSGETRGRSLATLSGENGYALSCGTGIETCTGLESNATLQQNCAAGKGDDRPGALTRPAAVWQSLLVRVDVDGNLLYQRVDQGRLNNLRGPPLGGDFFALRRAGALHDCLAPPRARHPLERGSL